MTIRDKAVRMNLHLKLRISCFVLIFMVLRKIECSTPKPTKADDSKVIWASIDTTTSESYINSLPVDPEHVNQTGMINPTILVKSGNETSTEIWSVVTDYERNIVFYIDYRAQYIGEYHIDKNYTSKKLQGMAFGIKNMAYDWITGNLYWTDVTMQWVMTAEKTFRFYTPIYRFNDTRAYAIAIHSKLRRLYMSLYEFYHYSIVETDLSGKNRRVLFSYPDVEDVIAMTIDYTEDRLYWTDTNYGNTLVVSGALDGSNRTVHGRGSLRGLFCGVASYLAYIYVSDLQSRYDVNGSYYRMLVIAKSTQTVHEYKLHTRPRRIAILSKNKERSNDQVSLTGECSSSPVCDHICLPRINATRECACSVGYHKQGDTGCVAKLVSDDYFLLADSAQGRIFQLPLNYTNSTSSNYSVVEVSKTRLNLTTIAVDMTSKYIYWSDKYSRTIGKSTLNGTKIFKLAKNHHASSMFVDPRSGNVYFVDEDYQYIYVMSSDGSFMKLIMMPNATNAANTSIQMIAQDSVNRKIYWTDTRSQRNKGQVWRMDLDGMNRELVFDNLYSPGPIAVDHKRRSLLVVLNGLSTRFYEIPLDKLKTIHNTSIYEFGKRIVVYSLKTMYNVLEIKVQDDKMYVFDDKAINIEVANLSISGFQHFQTFGPSEFFSLTSMSIFSKHYHKTYIENITSPCLKRSKKCSNICIDKSDTESICLYDDKDSKKENNHTKSDTTNSPPNYGNSCPEDIIVQIPECSNLAKVSWREPTWTDDHSVQSRLKIGKPNLPGKFSAGVHPITYTATDPGGLVGICRFKVIVYGIFCKKPRGMSHTMTSSNKLCGDRFGSTYTISCKDSNKVIQYGERTYPALTNICGDTGQWRYSNLTYISCAITNNTARNSKLTRGKLAAICIVSIVIVICIIVIVIKMRNRGYLKFGCFEFSFFRRNRNDDSDDISLILDVS